MAWNHVVLEVYCGCRPESGDRPPTYCVFGPGRPDAHCFAGASSQDEALPCPYVGWTRARNTAVVTDPEGRALGFESFSGDPNASEADFGDAEREWTQRWATRFQTP